MGVGRTEWGTDVEYVKGGEKQREIDFWVKRVMISPSLRTDGMRGWGAILD